MIGFYILLLVIFFGFTAIVWIMLSEKKKESPKTEKKPSSEPQISPKDLLGRLGLETPPISGSNAVDKKSPLPDLFKKDLPRPALTALPAQGTASLKIAPPPLNKGPETAQKESELSLKYDDLLGEHKELQAKYAKLESMLHEKNTSLEKTERTLTNELKTQKEFNKVKDILEKELKETKDKYRILQAELAESQTASAGHLRRISQHEEKIKKLEIGVLTSESAITDAQSETLAARKKIAELEGKLRESENHILEKNRKIEDLVNKLNPAKATDTTAPLAPTQATPSQTAENNITPHIDIQPAQPPLLTPPKKEETAPLPKEQSPESSP